MERQRLMGDESDESRSKRKTKYDDNDRRSAQSSFLESENGKCKRNNFKSYFSDLFGSKTVKVNNMVVSCLSVALFYLALVCIVNGVSVAEATPLHLLHHGKHPSMFISAPSARNIRHLPCVSRLTKEEGICMFAIDCLKANGTHLGTCIDRFYFGSCCQMPEQLDPVSTNHIEDNSIFGSYQKPQTDKVEQIENIDQILNSLSPLTPSSPAPPTSSKTGINNQPTSTSNTISHTSTLKSETTTIKSTSKYTTTQKSKPPSAKPGFANQKPNLPSQKPGTLTQKPSYSSTKYGSSSYKPAPTQGNSKLPTTVSQGTRRPSPSTAHTTHTKKPITNGVIVNNTIYTGKLPTGKPTVNKTSTDDKLVSLVPSLKPSRNTTVTTTQAPVTTTTSKNTFVPTRRATTTTTERSTIKTSPTSVTISIKNTTLSEVTESQKVTTTTSKPTTTKQTEQTTEIPFKLSTFQSVQDIQTKKPTPKPSIKPSNDDLGSQLPFGTRLPSTTPGTDKQSTTSLTKKPSSKPSSTTKFSTTAVPHVASSTHAAQRPFQKPKPSLKPDKPVYKPDVITTIPTSRPLVQRPQNSTLSNRRTTLKPTTSIRKPISDAANASSSAEPTKRPTTIIYRPTIETKPSLKPTYISQRPVTSTTISRPTVTYQKQNQTTSKPTFEVTTKNATVAYVISSTDKTTISSQTKGPTISSTDILKEKPTSTVSTESSKIPTVTEKVSTSRPGLVETENTSSKPTSATIKPGQTQSLPTLEKSTTTERPAASNADSNSVQKPIADEKKPIATTTQKIGLVTWSNFADSPGTSSTASTTVKEEDWSPVTPPPEWVLLQTVSPSNATTSTTRPSSATIPSKKPIFDVQRPATFSTPVPTTAASPNQTESSTKPVETNKTTTEMEGLINVATKPDGVTTEKPTELSTFMSVSGGPTTTKIPDSTTTRTEDKNTTISEDVDEEGTTIEGTTSDYLDNNSTTLISETTTVNSTTVGDKESTDKSTVSPIEGITSSGSPLTTADSVNMSDYKDVCGRRLWPEARVVGGSRANFGRWPWQVSLRQWRTSTYLHKCGAALLSENWAVTAAHCVDSVPPSDLLLRLGEHDLASEEEPYGFQERRVQIVASHPQFDPRTFEYDLALLRFYEPVTFQPNILPVCVPANDEGFVGKTAYVTGWGRLYEDGPLPSVLQEVSVPVLENHICEQMYRAAGYIEHIPHIFICAGWRKGGFDSCEGDSGGPMVLQREDNRFLLAGIISWGIGCAEPNQPGVYTRISEFRDWINQILQF